MKELLLFCFLASTYLMLMAKRMPALIRGFRQQAFFLVLVTLVMAIREERQDLYIICALVFLLKVIFIPRLLYKIIKRLKITEHLGLFINPQLSLLFALGFSYLSWVFSAKMGAFGPQAQIAIPAVSFFVVLAGMFLMVFRMTALAQIIGLLVMENGLFLLASGISGGMPFFVEIAIFFDIFVSVLIMGFFLHRISNLFTHIDVNKLSHLKG